MVIKNEKSVFDTDFTGTIDIVNIEKYMSGVSQSMYQTWLAAPFISKKGTALINSLYLQLRQGRQFDVTEIVPFINQLVSYCRNNPNDFIMLSRCKDPSDYFALHSVNVTVISLAIGSRLGFNDKQLFMLGLAGLLHNIGKVKFPDIMLKKTSKYTLSEMRTMHKHPEFGYEILRSDSNVHEDVLSGVLHHHERVDGGGYPSGHMGKFISPIGRIIAIAESYDAITSMRPNASSVTTYEALQKIYALSGKAYDSEYVKALISVLGIYPIGTLVKLNTGQLGIVIDENKLDLKKPKVLIITDVNEQPTEPYSIDLQNDITGKSIVYVENSQSLNIDIDKYIMEFIGK